MWKDMTRTLEGSAVRLEPLEPRNERGLFEAAQNSEVWRWMPYDASRSREDFQYWFGEALSRSEAGAEVAFATVDIRIPASL